VIGWCRELCTGREDEEAGRPSRDVDDQRTQSAGGAPSAASVGLEPSPAATVALPLRLLRRVTAQRRTAQLARTYTE